MTLPVDAAIPALLAALRRANAVVLEAPPGAGKTTRVPPALLSLDPREVLVLEPRRLAARLAARRVAAELGESLGETVGYHVRFDDVSGPRTRLRFLTEGVLTRRLLADASLDQVATVVLDEFHERHLDGDLALALLRRLQATTRPDLRLVVMSATLDAAPIAAYLGDCPVVRSEGRLFETDLRYTPASSASLEDQVLAALGSLPRPPGDILVFLPGAREIRRALDATQNLLAQRHWLGVALYGDLSPEEQDRAVTPADRPKVIFSTNVAESSVTIEGVRVVIDSGLARVPHDSPWTGLPSLEIRRVSQASARQRAGRAARTGPGVVIRLYTEEDLFRRPAHDTPEILRRELSQAILDLRALRLHVPDLPWLDAPPAAAVDAAEALLDRLEAHNDTGRQMARLPVHPRIARLAVEAARLGALKSGADTAARLSLGVAESTYESRRVAAVIERALARGVRAHDPHAVEKATLTAFPDRVAKRHRDTEVQLAGGGSAILSGHPHRVPAWLVATDIEHRRERGLPLIRTWTEIEPDWLIEYFSGCIEDRRELIWNRDSERVDEVRSLRYDGLVIEETRARPADTSAAAALLAEKAAAVLHRFADPEELTAWLARVHFAAQHGGVAHPPDPRQCLAELAEGCVSMAELENVAAGGGLLRALEARLGDPARLERIAPAHLALPSGRRAKVHYAAGKPPWVESRLQDFFGLRETPRVAGGAVPVVCHLLAPSQRPVQITQDLAGFWERHYPEIRRELSRRYPKHKWPEKP